MAVIYDSILQKHKGLLVVSFGTSRAPDCEKSIGAIERDLAAAFPDRIFRRAFTSDFIRRKIEKDRGTIVDDVSSALRKMAANGITDVLVQPTHMLDGFENRKMTLTVQANADAFETVRIGRPLLWDERDLYDLARMIPQLFTAVTGEDALLLMGHGSLGNDCSAYSRINALLRNSGHGNMSVALMNAPPTLSDFMPAIRKAAPRRIFLSPFMVVAGRHARHDLLGKEPGSWQSMLKDFHTIGVMKGLGEYPEIRSIYIRHALEAAEDMHKESQSI